MAAHRLARRPTDAGLARDASFPTPPSRSPTSTDGPSTAPPASRTSDTVEPHIPSSFSVAHRDRLRWTAYRRSPMVRVLRTTYCRLHAALLTGLRRRAWNVARTADLDTPLPVLSEVPETR